MEDQICNYKNDIQSTKNWTFTERRSIHLPVWALAHNLLKVAGIHELLSVLNENNTRTGGEKRIVFLTCSISGTYWTAPIIIIDYILQINYLSRNL